MTNNTIPNVPRELLERARAAVASTNTSNWSSDLLRDIHAILSAPSPAGVDGLEVVAYRVSLPGEPELGTWLDEDAENEPQMCLHEPLCRLSDAQRIIDGLRGEVEELRKAPCECGAPVGYVSGDKYHAEHERLRECRSERDQQAQRIGELEGLLRRAYEHAPIPMQCRIDAALSAGKEGE